ncbi:hypothetical protein AAEI00_20445 [Shewanella algae]|uniref:hypothetical protein n=1 Tax=Shewanella algae TaxID=38313 RepID=UPI00313BC429
MASKKSKLAGKATQDSRREELLQQKWGEDALKEIALWDRNEHNGWTTVPRTMPYICHILDKLGDKGKPLAQTYMALWARMTDQSLIEIREKDTLAYESGFSGQRAVHTWTSRMKTLKELGFIDAKRGTCGDYQYTLVLNPLKVIHDLYKDKAKDEAYEFLEQRMQDVGAGWE